MLPTIESQAQRLAMDEPYLKVQLTDRRAALLPMGQAQEAIAIPSDRITPVPNMPSCVLGLLNQRSRVFWAIDLPRLLDLSDQPFNGQQYNLVIVKSGNNPGNSLLGLVVPKVQGILRFNAEEIYSPDGEAPSSLVSYLQGYFTQAEETLWVLDTEAIIHSPTLSKSC
jgi:positive phototaxis protein PixI